MPDTIYTKCTNCESKIRVKNRNVAGKKTRCPKCEETFVIRLYKASSSSKSVNKETDTPGTSPKIASKEKAPPKTLADRFGKLISWTDGDDADTRRYHMVHVSPDGIILAAKIRSDEFSRFGLEANVKPASVPKILQQSSKAIQIPLSQLAKATFVEHLKQLELFDVNRKKTKVPSGEEQEQAEVFAAIKQHCGGHESEDAAGAWSVIKSQLGNLIVIAILGGLAMMIATTSSAHYHATGRRAGMKKLLNWVGYSIGPFWMSVIVGGVAAFAIGRLLLLLLNRPKRRVLEFQS